MVTLSVGLTTTERKAIDGSAIRSRSVSRMSRVPVDLTRPAIHRRKARPYDLYFQPSHTTVRFLSDLIPLFVFCRTISSGVTQEPHRARKKTKKNLHHRSWPSQMNETFSVNLTLQTANIITHQLQVACPPPKKIKEVRVVLKGVKNVKTTRLNRSKGTGSFFPELAMRACCSFAPHRCLAVDSHKEQKAKKRPSL